MTFNTIKEKIKSIFQRTPEIFKKSVGGIRARLNSSGYGSGSKFPSGMSRTSSSVNIHDHYKIRQAARDMMYDSMEARALVESQVDIIVDSGLKPKSTPIASILGITPEEAEKWADEVDEIFDLWAKSKNSNRARINNHYQDQRLYQLFQQRDNDIFVRLYYGRDKDQINPVQTEFIDPNQINGFGYTNSFSNLISDDGIIRDKNGREIGYKVWNYDPANGKYTSQTIPARGEKSGRIMMTHGYNPEYAGQGRGFSKMAHILQELESLTDYKTSVLQKAINQSGFVGVIENEEQDASQPLEGKVAGPRAEYGISPDATADTGTGEADDPYINWDSQPEATIRQPGSTLVGNLRRGDKWKNLADTSPGPTFDMFCNSIFSYIAASMGTSIEVVRKVFNQNYSASRATLILVYRNAVVQRSEMASDFLNPVREMVIAEEIAAGRIQAPGFSDPRLRAAWLNCEWSGSPMPNIDPMKSAQADQKYVEMGAQTLDDVAENFNGSSGKANRAKNTRQYAELPTPPWPIAPIQTGVPDDENNSNDNRDDK